MKKNLTLYKCDLCFFEIKNEHDVIEFTVDNGHDMSGAPSMSFIDKQICRACLLAANVAQQIKDKK